MITLRDYQEVADRQIDEAFARCDSALCVMATGMGKTVLFAHRVARHARRGLASVILLHRDELAQQAAASVEEICGLRPAVEMGPSYSPEQSAHPPLCVVASVQSLSRPGRLARFKKDRFVEMIIDEAHHAAAATYGEVMDHFRCKKLGVTATPLRGDGIALGTRFESLACSYPIEWGVANGWLVGTRQLLAKIDCVDFSRIRTVAGDWAAGELDEELSKEGPLHAVARPVVEQAGGDQVITFCAGVKQARALCAVMNRYREGFAGWLCGDKRLTPPDVRKQLVASYRSGDLQCLVNVGVLIEGFDAPATGMVAVARPTKSLGLYLQMLGRATRPLKGVVDGPPTARERVAAIRASAKPSCRVLDFVGASTKHSLKQITAADALGGEFSPQVREYARRQFEERPQPTPAMGWDGEPMDAAAELLLARDCLALLAEEEERRRRIKAEVQYRLQESDGTSGEHALTNAPLVPHEPATAKQVWRLVHMGWRREAAERLSKRQASACISKAMNERSAA